MAKLNVSIDDRLRDELFKLIPPRRRSQVVNKALWHELLRRKRRQATEVGASLAEAKRHPDRRGDYECRPSGSGAN
ncbi:hypothetical protein [Candidatus Nitrospira nitrificans]|uniref:Uncharacterized protein n=1 Tax=Candidatus Nitrospira nitrificans TaxID=1742973 RepID=A0A0S4L7V4_9BACT|nr:hypothetical protein [Candidatus Nitrospira nitrificans]CUS32878.1 hypothetical protein COMA2_110138 [Candidatus Nitrospira nitrificans]